MRCVPRSVVIRVVLFAVALGSCGSEQWWPLKLEHVQVTKCKDGDPDISFTIPGRETKIFQIFSQPWCEVWKRSPYWDVTLRLHSNSSPPPEYFFDLVSFEPSSFSAATSNPSPEATHE
jgi:hypothetical protein